MCNKHQQEVRKDSLITIIDVMMGIVIIIALTSLLITLHAHATVKDKYEETESIEERCESTYDFAYTVAQKKSLGTTVEQMKYVVEHRAVLNDISMDKIKILLEMVDIIYSLKGNPAEVANELQKSCISNLRAIQEKKSS